ncbi:hypothetical protein BN1723_020610, partial [Verticillium longisporum]
MGSFGRVASLLREVWHQTATIKQSPCLSAAGSPGSNAAVAAPEVVPYIHWRDVMQMKGWDFLLI